MSVVVQKPGKLLPFHGKGLAQTPGSASIIDVSASSATPNPALSEPDLRIAVTRILHRGTYWRTKHAADDRSYRNVTDDDIQAMLEGPWTLATVPEWDASHRNWKYKLAGHDIEGDDLTVVVAVNTEELTITVITNF